jgi:hypothetical protein
MARQIFTDCLTLQVGCILYTSAEANELTPPGFYSNGTNCYTVNSNGVITSIGVCPTTTTSTTTSTTTTTAAPTTTTTAPTTTTTSTTTSSTTTTTAAPTTSTTTSSTTTTAGTTTTTTVAPAQLYWPLCGTSGENNSTALYSTASFDITKVYRLTGLSQTSNFDPEPSPLVPFAQECHYYTSSVGPILSGRALYISSFDGPYVDCAECNAQPTTTTTTTAAPITIEYLVVAGGGAGGGDIGAGGGAGGLLSGSFLLQTGSYIMNVGSGGLAFDWQNGQSSSISSTYINVTSIGGGRGAQNYSYASNGGSGGGAATLLAPTPGTGSAGQGFSGGGGASGGGGGASQIGQNSTQPIPQSTIFGGPGGSGSQWLDGIFYAGGGGGQSYGSASGGFGGPGGGGTGGTHGNEPTASAGQPNTGGGGGSAFTAGAGGSGIIKLRYFGSGSQATGGQISYSGSYTYHTFTSSGTFIY